MSIPVVVALSLLERVAEDLGSGLDIGFRVDQSDWPRQWRVTVLDRCGEVKAQAFGDTLRTALWNTFYIC